MLIAVWTLHKDSAVAQAFSEHLTTDVVKSYAFAYNSQVKSKHVTVYIITETLVMLTDLP